MQIYSSTLKGPLKANGFLDPDDNTIIKLYWGAITWNRNTVYRQGDVCRPTTDNGYYYQCNTNGVSGGTEPSWSQDETSSGTTVFTAVPWDLFLLPNETIQTSVWSTSNSEISISSTFFLETATGAIIQFFPSTLTEVNLTNKVSKSNGESLSRTIKYKTNQQ